MIFIKKKTKKTVNHRLFMDAYNKPFFILLKRFEPFLLVRRVNIVVSLFTKLFKIHYTLHFKKTNVFMWFSTKKKMEKKEKREIRRFKMSSADRRLSVKSFQRPQKKTLFLFFNKIIDVT